MPPQLIPGVISNNPPFVYVPTRTNQPGHLGHIPYEGRYCFFYYVIHAFFPIILAPILVQGEEGSTAKERLETAPHLCCITSWSKPSIQPSDPICQVALISTSRITTTMKKYTTSLYEQFRNNMKSNRAKCLGGTL